MSLDYPEYQELRKKSRFLAMLWRIGDIGYYLGLVCAVLSPLGIVWIQITNRKFYLPWNTVLLMAIQSTVFWVIFFWISSQLKNFALRKGKFFKTKL